MHVHRAMRELASTLMLCAALFGGLGFGIGNAVQMSSGGAPYHGGAVTHAESADPASLDCLDGHAALASHAHDAPLPAHCFFCLDGVSPAPLAPTSTDIAAIPAILAAFAPQATPAYAGSEFTRPHARGPPALV